MSTIMLERSSTVKENLSPEPTVDLEFTRPYPSRSIPNLPWRMNMTLCIAAACREGGEPRLVLAADKRVEAGWYGGDVGFKMNWAAKYWPVLLAGEVARADELITTYRNFLADKELKPLGVHDLLKGAAQEHKVKMCDHFVRMKLGIPYERFLSKGKIELGSEVFRETLFEIAQLGFKCQLIISGFTYSRERPVLGVFRVSESGEVSRCDNFSAIGSGEVVAESVLYSRKQSRSMNLASTLYTVYEAFKTAEIAGVPGVGELTHLLIIEPAKDPPGSVSGRITTKLCIDKLNDLFDAYGPKSTDGMGNFIQDGCLRTLETQPPPASEADQPS